MHITTERLIIRRFTKQDADALYAIKYDEQVLKYSPDFIKRDATITDIKEAIANDDGTLYAICLKDSGGAIGAITVSRLDYLYETQIGWKIRSEYTGQGYASEAGAAASDELLEALRLDYIVAVMDVDNPASFRTAQRSGFRLFEKRVPYDYHYSTCNAEDHGEVQEHFAAKQAEIGSCYYYFRKYNKNSQTAYRFYGDARYEGRFS